MLLRIVRDLTSEEVEEKIGRFRKRFGMGFEEFEEFFLKQELEPRLVNAYFEWAELVDSFRGYVEDGALDYTAEGVKDFKRGEVALLLPRRTELLYKLADLRVESINDLAKKVRRGVRNVYQNLEALREFGFVRLSKRKGRALTPETLVKEITFLIH